jgi:hypothetical protein
MFDRSRKDRSAPDLFDDCFDNFGMSVAMNQRGLIIPEIDVLVPIHIVEPTPLAVIHKRRERPVEGDAPRVSPGHEGLGLLVQPLRFGSLGQIGGRHSTKLILK